MYADDVAIGSAPPEPHLQNAVALTEDQRAELKEAFYLIDTDNSGTRSMRYRPSSLAHQAALMPRNFRWH